MHEHCDAVTSDLITWTLCYLEADTFYTAVNWLGESFFEDGQAEGCDWIKVDDCTDLPCDDPSSCLKQEEKP
jgi:hypothetical protein